VDRVILPNIFPHSACNHIANCKSDNLIFLVVFGSQHDDRDVMRVKAMPFKPGESVEVTVRLKHKKANIKVKYPLRGSVGELSWM
jgi:hypothetical protein